MRALVSIALLMCVAAPAFAQDEEGKTEITGYYQQFRNFSFKSGYTPIDFPDTKLKGGGFTVAHSLAPWFAMWTQLSIYGSIDQPAMGLRVINNLEGIRYQTKQHGPFRFYAKGGLGFSNYSFSYAGGGTSGNTFSLGYGGGAQIWLTDWIGATLDISHISMGLPNLTDLPGREKWDSGLTYTTGISIRF